MEPGKDPKARINPAARHDAPGEVDQEAPGGDEGGSEEARPRNEQVKPKQGAELNPLDPGGIGG